MNPRTPACQPYPGPMFADNYADQNLQKIGGSSPQMVENMKQTRGRYLGQFGKIPGSFSPPKIEPFTHFEVISSIYTSPVAQFNIYYNKSNALDAANQLTSNSYSSTISVYGVTKLKQKVLICKWQRPWGQGWTTNCRGVSGLGNQDMSGATGYDPHYQPQLAYKLEYEDDSNGSGIFDPKGRQATSNADTGVFASHYSLPGYLAREHFFRVNEDVVDITDNAAVVPVPAGGNYVEKGAALACIPDSQGGPCRPGTSITPAPVPNPNSPYAFMTQRQPVKRPVRQVPFNPGYTTVPFRKNYTNVERVSTAQGTQTPVPVSPALVPVAQSAPDLPQASLVPIQSTVNVFPTTPIPVKPSFKPRQLPPPPWVPLKSPIKDPQKHILLGKAIKPTAPTMPVPMKGLGETPSSSTWAYAFGGALIGAGIALVFKVRNIKVPLLS